MLFRSQDKNLHLDFEQLHKQDSIQSIIQTVLDKERHPDLSQTGSLVVSQGTQTEEELVQKVPVPGLIIKDPQGRIIGDPVIHQFPQPRHLQEVAVDLPITGGEGLITTIIIVTTTTAIEEIWLQQSKSTAPNS